MGRAVPILSPTVTVLATRPSWPTGLAARPASETVAWVVAHAGARPKERDTVDARIVANFQAGTGRFVNSQNDVGGYPTAAPTQRTLTVPATSGSTPGWPGSPPRSNSRRTASRLKLTSAIRAGNRDGRRCRRRGRLPEAPA